MPVPDLRASPQVTMRAHSSAPAEPLWVLRVNPLRRDRLADPQLRELVGRLEQAERRVTEAARHCSDALYEKIGATTDAQARGQLIALRRDIHNDRLSRTVATTRVVAAETLQETAVAAWLEARLARDRLRDSVTSEQAGATDRERRRLATLLGDADLRRSLALVAPEVYEAAERYRALVSRGGPIPAKARKPERGLIQYVTRAMIRTSPLSRFTAVGIATHDEDGISPDQAGYEGATAFPDLDRVMLNYVLGGLYAPHEPDGSTWVQVAPTSSPDTDSDVLYFLKPQGDGMRRLSTPITGTVRLLLEATAMGPIRADAVAEQLATASGIEPDQALPTVLAAVRAGLLCTMAGPEDAAVDLNAFLAAQYRPRSGDLGQSTGPHREQARGEPASPAWAVDPRLADIAARLPRLATAGPTDRGVELAALRSALTALSLEARRPAQILVEEDYVLRPLRVATSSWQRQLDDLAGAVELLSVFDRLHDVRALLSAVFVERFGAGAAVSLAEHAPSLVEEVYRRGGTVDGVAAPGAGPADGSLDRLQKLRQRITAAARADLAGAQERSQDVTWSLDDIAELLAPMPERFRRDPLSYGVLVQPWQGRLVYNDAYAGHGMLYGRFLAADRRLGGDAAGHLRARLLRQYGSDGSRVVEDLGLHRLNVNAHMPVLADGLRPGDWFGLRLVHDAGTDTLQVEDGDGVPLRVLTLGAGNPEMFPAPLRLAAWLVSGGRTVWDPLEGERDDERETLVCPRLSVGTVVLTRRRWYGGVELATALAAGSVGERLTALTAWRARHGVPEEIVMKTPLDEEYRRSAQESDEDPQTHLRRQKPQYADLASALCADVLPSLVRRRDAGYLEEALPGAADGPHATEWIVEIGRAPGGPFRYAREI